MFQGFLLFLHRLGVAGASPGILLAGGCLALLVLPSLVVTTRTALEGLPASLRLTGFALGLTHSQIVRKPAVASSAASCWPWAGPPKTRLSSC